MKPSLKEQLKTWQRKHPEYTPKNKIVKSHNKTNKANEESLSHKEWKDIMGVNMPRYKRNRGAFRQL